jgi:hypothetical protein
MTMIRQALTRYSRVAVLATLLAGTIFGEAPGVSVALAADPSSDIPGIDLPGTVAAGRLGGAIYDVVYRLSVAPGHVIVASLTGAAGTDFDLYLFDASATTVLSDVGLLKKSTGPTSTESLSWPSSRGGTYYIDLNGATAVEGDYRLTVQMVPDPTPPSLSMVLAGGRGSTNQLTVPVSLTATDDLSGVAEMALGTDGLTFSPWEAFQTSPTWTFSPGDGPRVLWAKVRNGVGLESAPVKATTTIDTVPPSVIDLNPPPGSSVVGLRPPLSVTFSEPMDPRSWSDLGLIVQSATGNLVAGGFAYDVVGRTGTFVPSAALQPGAAYVVTVGDVKDIAGNRVSFSGSWAITPLSPTSLTASADPKVIVHGQSTRIGVALSGAPLPATLDVLSSTSSGQYVPLTAIPAEGGSTTLAVRPASNTTYRFRYAGAFGVAPDTVDVPVLVRRSISLVGRNSSVVSSSKVGTPVRLTATLGPATPGVSVSFRLYRFDAARRAWAYAGSHGRTTDGAGRASLTWTPLSAGSYYWRASVVPTAEFANNVSPVYRWTVRR